MLNSIETEGIIHLAVKTGETGVAPRYASALFELADESGQLDKVARDLRAINNAITDVQDLGDVMINQLTDLFVEKNKKTIH